MQCPACRQKLTETEVICGHCQFSLGALSAQLGIPPQLTPPVADLAEVLTRKEKKALVQEIEQMEQRFPDIVGIAVFADIPETLSPELYAFWLFNRASLFSSVEQGGSNHGVLLLIDAAKSRATAMIGYGLEPLIPEQTLEICLIGASHHLKKGNRAAAAEAFFRELPRQLLELSATWPKLFGYSETHPWYDASTGQLVQAVHQTEGDLY
jgi:uncharacterized membrane protein YgcG